MTFQKAPKPVIDTEATTSNAIDTLVYNALLAENKKSEPIHYTGYSLYSTLVPIQRFTDIYDPDFVKKVLGGHKEATTILEAYIFVPEICNFLPQPDLKVLKDLSRSGAPTEAEAAAGLSALKKIERFPRGYQAAIASSPLSFLAPVSVKFDRDFDYSTGVMTAT